eukprot:05743.XXX_153215_153376_1 [CDS] Oithona nana genome sequencing.
MVVRIVPINISHDDCWFSRTNHFVKKVFHCVPVKVMTKVQKQNIELIHFYKDC